MGESIVLYLLLYFGCISNLYGGTIQQMYIRNNSTAIKEGEAQVVCEIAQFTNKVVVVVYKTDFIPTQSLTGLPSLTVCDPTICYGTIKRHTIISDSSKVTITVNNLNRTEDQKWWTCALSSGDRKSIHLTVYTVPQTLQLKNPPDVDQDLTLSAVTLTCSTDCTYPQPSFTWFYTEDDNSKHEWSTPVSATNNASGCTDSEKRFSSQLSLGRFETFPGNLLKTVKFVCGIPSFPGMSQSLFTASSTNIQFAVRVTNVTIKDGNTTLVRSVEATNGISKVLTCSTSESRPEATIIWYFGNLEKHRSKGSISTWSFIPKQSNNGTEVYCKAFNIQLETQAVSSIKATLFIKDTFFSVEGEDGMNNITVAEYDTGVTFRCYVFSDLKSDIKMLFQGEVIQKQSQTIVMEFTRRSIGCSDAGVYTCSGSNKFGSAPAREINLLVRCLPRPLKQKNYNFTSKVNTPTTLSFTTLAYPEPGPTGFTWQKINGNIWTQLRSNEDLQISSTGLQSNLTILNVSGLDFGQYRVTVINKIGSYEHHLFLFKEDGEIDICKSEKISIEEHKTGTIIGIACSALITCIAFATYGIYVTILLRRERSKKESMSPVQSTENAHYINIPKSMVKTDVHKGSAERFRNDNEGPVQLYTDLVRYSKEEGTMYDIIKKS